MNKFQKVVARLLLGSASVELPLATTAGIAEASTPNCVAAPAPGVNWSGCTILIHLSGRNLTGAIFSSQTDLTGANFSGVTLKSATLYNVNVTRANFSHANLDLAMLIDANATSANFTSATLTHVNMQGTKLIHANLNGSNMTGARTTGADFTGATCPNGRIHKTSGANR